MTTSQIMSKMAQLTTGTKYENKVYVFGGYVRDLLCGRLYRNLDFIVGVNPTEYAEFVLKSIGAASCILINFGSAEIEIDGIKLKFYHHDMDLPDWREQFASQCDFTINAISIDICNNKMYDPTGRGHNDILLKVITSVGDPEVNIRFSPIRIIRAIRLAASMGYNVDRHYIEAIKALSDKINLIRPDDMKEELEAILTSNQPSIAFRIMNELGILRSILPQLAACVGVEQNKYHHENVFDHIMTVVDGVPVDLVTRWSALFHDIAKPVVKSVSPEKGVQFIGHEDEGAVMADNILRALGYGNEFREAVKTVVSLHMGTKHKNISKTTLRRWSRKAGRWINNLLDVVESDEKAHHQDVRDLAKIADIRARIAEIATEPPPPKRVITGHDLIQLGMKPGPKFKEILDYIQSLVDTSDEELTKEYLLEVVRAKLEKG